MAEENSVRLRRFPYPFKAALAICSDTDRCSREAFLAIHRFLNCAKDGLGLPVADSFFALGAEEKQMAYFEADGRTPSADAPFILEAIRQGLIDAIHSWGDFVRQPLNPALLRPMAERLLNDLNREGLRIPVWINHGNERNRQNLLARLGPTYAGDDPTSPFYTLDLIRQLGVRFYWCSELLPWPLSCAVASGPLLLQRRAVCAGKNLVKRLICRPERQRSRQAMEELAVPVRMRDQTVLLAFSRCCIPSEQKIPATRHSLRHVLAERVLDALISAEGYLVVYTHLAFPWDTPVKFQEQDRLALTRLSALYHDGRIWVAPTSRLLHHWLLQRYLVWDCVEHEQRLLITIKGLDDPVFGWRLPLAQELAGLCFYTPRPWDTIIILGGQELPVRSYPADNTGMAAVGLDPQPPPTTDLLECRL